MATPTTAGRVIIGQGITVKGDIRNCEEVIVRGFFDAGSVEAKTVVVEADGEPARRRRRLCSYFDGQSEQGGHFAFPRLWVASECSFIPSRLRINERWCAVWDVSPLSTLQRCDCYCNSLHKAREEATEASLLRPRQNHTLVTPSPQVEFRRSRPWLP